MSSISRSRRASPSRSTGRARCCCSARRTSTTTTFRQTMSVIVKHRTDLDTVAARVGVKLEPGAAAGDEPAPRHASRRHRGHDQRARAMPPAKGDLRRMPEHGPGGLDGELLAFAEDLREEGVRRRHLGDARRVRRAGARLLDATRARSGRRSRRRSPSRPRTAGCSTSCSSASSSARPRPRRSAWRSPSRRRATGERRDRPRRAAPADRRRRCGRAPSATLRDLARLAIAAFGRGEGSGVLGVDVQRIRRALGLRTEPQPELPSRRPAPPRRAARAAAALRAAPAPRARARR